MFSTLDSNNLKNRPTASLKKELKSLMLQDVVPGCGTQVLRYSALGGCFIRSVPHSVDARANGSMKQVVFTKSQLLLILFLLKNTSYMY